MGEISIFRRTIENRTGDAMDEISTFGRPTESRAENNQLDPTRLTYLSWAGVFDYFNLTLHGGLLPRPLITYQRTPQAYGFYYRRRFVTADGSEHACEIAINPEHLHNRPPELVLSTFEHEICHLWREHFGKRKAPKDGYHDQEWAATMEKIGLMPSGTDGKKTGYRVTHYIIADGLFDRACRKLLERGFQIPYGDAGHLAQTAEGEDEREAGKSLARKQGKAASKSKFTCPNANCAQVARGNPHLNLICGRCHAETGDIVRLIARSSGV
jgi:SprT-like family